MITYTDIKRFDDMPFPDYIKLQPYSHSFLKGEFNGVKAEIEVTRNMRLGSLVDAILTDPKSANMKDELYLAAKEIAYEVTQKFGFALPSMKKQVSYTAVMNHNGFSMLTKARLDFLLEKQLVLDLKVTYSKDVHGLIEFMGYKNQVWHYAKLSGVSKAFLMVYCVPLKKVMPLIPIDVASDMSQFWANKILKFGKTHEESIS